MSSRNDKKYTNKQNRNRITKAGEHGSSVSPIETTSTEKQSTQGYVRQSDSVKNHSDRSLGSKRHIPPMNLDLNASTTTSYKNIINENHLNSSGPPFQQPSLYHPYYHNLQHPRPISAFPYYNPMVRQPTFQQQTPAQPQSQLSQPVMNYGTPYFSRLERQSNFNSPYVTSYLPSVVTPTSSFIPNYNYGYKNLTGSTELQPFQQSLQLPPEPKVNRSEDRSLIYLVHSDKFKGYVCPQCNFPSRSQTGLKIHIIKRHESYKSRYFYSQKEKLEPVFSDEPKQ